MKMQLDTTNKTIKIEENVKISKLIEVLKQMLPTDWKNFTLETHTTIVNWNEPYIIREYPRRQWFESPWYCSTNAINMSETSTIKGTSGDNMLAECSLKSGVFNVEA